MRICCIASIVLTLFLMHAKSYGQVWKQYADSAKVYGDNEEYDRAIVLYNKALNELTPDSVNTINYASICNTLGGLYLAQEKYEQAEPFFLDAKNLEEKISGKEDTNYAASCNNLGNVYWCMGRYKKAEPFYLEARQITEKVFGKENAHYAASCNNLGNLYGDMGLFDTSESFYLEAKRIRGTVFGRESIDFAKSCNNLAILYLYMGKYEQAEPLYLEAKAIKEKILGKENMSYAYSCNNLAVFYLTIGQHKKAETLFFEGREIEENILGRENHDYAQNCINLASLYFETGEFKKAESFYLEGMKIMEKVLGKNHPDYAASCDDIADLYAATSQYKKAENFYLEAQQLWETLVGKEHIFYAANANKLGNLYTSTGKYNNAELLYLEAKQIRERALGKEHTDYYKSCISLANLYWLMQKPHEAYDLYTEAYRSQKIQVNNIFQFTSEVEKQSYLKKTDDFEDYFFSFSTSAYRNFNLVSYDVSLSNRNLILSSSQQLKNLVYTSGDTSVKIKYSKWIEAREQLAYWYAKPVDERPDYVKDLEEQANSLEKELTRTSSAFQKQQIQNDIDWKVVQQNLKSNEAAIEFSSFKFYNGKRWTDSIYYVALLLTKNSAEPTIIPLFESRQLNNYKTKTALYSLNQKQFVPYNLIWKPIEKHLQGVTKIYFAPSGILYRISLAALPVNNHEVISDKYQLIQLNTTASVLNQSEYSINTSDTICLFGGIHYDVDSATLKQSVAAYHVSNDNRNLIPGNEIRSSELSYLPYTEKEIGEIKNMGGEKNFPVFVYDGSAASEESIKAFNGTSSPAVLHIATHGFFFPDPKEKKKNNIQPIGSGDVFRRSDDPLFRSGLLMAGANAAWKGKPIEGVEDGILTAYEVSNLYLPNTKLVVLSACETGLGDIEGNEGVYGLQRAFKIAGVENLVMSLWKVGDKETSEFMQEFYKNMFAGQPINDAFYRAQTVMKNKYRNEPAKWAAWVLVE